MKPAVDTPADIARVQGRALLLWVMSQYRLPKECRLSWSDATTGERYTIMKRAAEDLGYAV